MTAQFEKKYKDSVAHGVAGGVRIDPNVTHLTT